MEIEWIDGFDIRVTVDNGSFIRNINIIFLK